MIKRAIMLKARVRLLPPSHPARILICQVGQEQPQWSKQVEKLQNRSEFIRAIPDITDVFSAEQLVAALENKVVRKRFLRNYRRAHVVPVLKEYDLVAFTQPTNDELWP